MELDDFFPDGFTHKVVTNEIISSESFSGIFRISVKNVEDFKRWLTAFEEKTNTTWILKRSLLSDERSTYIVNRSYVCQHSSFRKRKKDNGCLQVKDKNCMASFTIKVKRSTRHTRYNDPYIQLGLHGILNINFKHSHLVNDVEAWAWLKRSEETRKIFIQYFSDGMSPSAAIKHHESNLLLEDPDLLANSRRNPPKAWVYALHESWIKGNENCLTSSESNGRLKRRKKKKESDKSNSETDGFDDTVSKYERDAVLHQKPITPCIIHMNSKLINDCEDMKYLKIPNEVEDLFYKYFDDGLNVSEAMKLNSETVIKDKTLPPFNPSERLVTYIYKNWYQKRNDLDITDKNSDILLVSDEKNSVPYIMKDDTEDSHSTVQGLKNAPVMLSQAKNDYLNQENHSFQTASSYIPILPHPSTSKLTIESPLVIDKNSNVTSKEATTESEIMFDLSDKLSKSISTMPNMYYLFDSAKNQLIALNTPCIQNPVISVVNTYPIIPASNNTQVSFASLPSISTVNNMENSVPNSLFSDKENTSKLPSSLNTNKYFSSFFNNLSDSVTSELSVSNCQLTSDSYKELEIANNSQSCNQNVSSGFQQNILDNSDSCFELNSQGHESEAFNFNALVDKNSESVSTSDSEVKELSHVYLPVSQKSPTNSTISRSSSLISRTHEMKENSSNCSEIGVIMESEDSNFVPAVMNINSINSIQQLSRNEIFDNEDKAECTETSNFFTQTEDISQVMSVNENEDHQFLMSLLPELESIPDSFKMELKNKMRNLISFTRLAVNNNKMKGT